MKKIPKNEPKRPSKNIVFHIPEASAEERTVCNVRENKKLCLRRRPCDLPRPWFSKHWICSHKSACQGAP